MKTLQIAQTHCVLNSEYLLFIHLSIFSLSKISEGQIR